MNEADYLTSCKLCPRECGVNRLAGQAGICGADNRLKVARAALHMWEEPCLSGEEGSGTVFFSGCSLGCVYCQNYAISRGQSGKVITTERLTEIFLELADKGANNINLVTGAHYVVPIAEAIRAARQRGMKIPIVYNSSGYEKVESLKLLEGLVDIYLPDFKYMDDILAQRYSNAADYSDIAKAALAEMVRQAGSCEFDERGIMQKGVIVRQLLLPTYGEDAKQIIKYVYETYGDNVYFSLMNQYTPLGAMRNDSRLSQVVTAEEYDEVVDYALAVGVENGFIQEGGAAAESFIPQFDNEGV